MPRYVDRFALMLVATAALACQKEKASAPQLGEPVGAQVPARPNLPAFSIAFAVTKGSDPVPLLAPLVTAVSNAAAGCPALPKEATDNITAVDFTIAHGKMKVPPPSTAGGKCLASALDGKDLGAADAAPLDARLELKITGPAKP
jgi:hypothetical protein